MDLNIKGRRALVAGSSSGIGRACAAQLAEDGADLFLVARSAERLAETARVMAGRGVRVGFAAADLSIGGDIDRAFREATGFLGGVDILVNNAGGPKSGPFASLSDEEWQRAVDLNLMSAVRLSRLAISGMVERKWGRIVNITSTSVKQPIDGLMLSNSVRLAVVGFAKTLSNEVGPHGVTVNTVAPGFTQTERLWELAQATGSREGITAESILERWKSEVPLRRIGLPEEIAAAVAFLASEPGGYINGVVLTVDGGRTKGSL